MVKITFRKKMWSWSVSLRSYNVFWVKDVANSHVGDFSTMKRFYFWRKCFINVVPYWFILLFHSTGTKKTSYPKVKSVAKVTSFPSMIEKYLQRKHPSYLVYIVPILSRRLEAISVYFVSCFTFVKFSTNQCVWLCVFISRRIWFP